MAKPQAKAITPQARRFKDAFALSLAQQKPYPVKIMNWGYWGTVGVVASEEYRRRMQRVGLGSITPEQGMAGLNQLLAAPLPQLAMLVTENTGVLPNFDLTWSLTASHELGVVDLNALAQRLQAHSFAITSDVLNAAEPIPASEALLARLLLAQLVRFGLKPGQVFNLNELKQELNWLALYDKWFAESFALLARVGLIESVGAF
ncbi:hypothetical protein [Methylocucumis oryzae]|uniref:hypothetical protein n=1 Tax=Methylocucumis oryzae TaxID=1632867 RepID=UPI0006961EA2|nr:hypothetical protein [Methylocucumis oryzae]